MKKERKQIIPSNMKEFDYEATKFWNLLRTTKKWKEIYNQTESTVSLVVSLIVIATLIFLYESTPANNMNELIREIVNIGLTTLIGLLGFIISGIAIFTGTITNKLVKNIDSDNKALSLIGILFSFYYIGVIIGITVIVYIIMYLFTYSYIEIDVIKICVIGFVLSYLYFYSLFYSISLIGTCLKLFFVSYKFYDKG